MQDSVLHPGDLNWPIQKTNSFSKSKFPIFRADNYDFRNRYITNLGQIFPRHPLESVLELLQTKILRYLVWRGFERGYTKNVIFGRFWHFFHFLAYNFGIPIFHPLSHF